MKIILRYGKIIQCVALRYWNIWNIRIELFWYDLISKGDSGGPLTYKFHDQHILIGDTSWGLQEGCGLAGKYGVYGRISYFRPWFEKEMNKLEAPSYCSSGSEAGY